MSLLLRGASLGVLVASACSAPAPVSTVRLDEKVPVAGQVASVPEPPTDLRAACSAGLASFVAPLREPVTVEVHVSRSVPALAVVAARIEDFLRPLAASAGGKLAYRMIDPITDERKDEARRAGLKEVTIDAEQTAGLARAYSGATVRHGTARATIAFVDAETTASFPFWLANAIRQVRAASEGRPSRVGVVATRGAPALDDADLAPGTTSSVTLRSVFRETLPHYTFVDVDLSTDVDPALNGLVVTQRDAPWRDDELRRLDAFLLRGGSLAIFASHVELARADPSMKARVVDRGLRAWLSPFGLDMASAAVHDDELVLKLPVTTPTGAVALAPLPGVLALHDEGARTSAARAFEPGFAAFAGLHEVSFPYASPVTVHPERQPGATFQVVARTSASGYAVADATQDMRLGATPPAPGARRRIDLAVAVEGDLVIGRAKSSAPARLLLVASSQFLANPLARAGNPAAAANAGTMDAQGGDFELRAAAGPFAQRFTTGTIVAFKNVLDWMSRDDALVPCNALAIAPKSASATR